MTDEPHPARVGSWGHQTKGAPPMARFMDVHDGFVGVTHQQLQEAHARDLANQDAEGMSFETAWLDPESGKVFCLSHGPSKEALMRVHEASGHPCSEVYEIPVEVV
ncbi:MAG: nickel-binding protein [Microbacteriaceae bacterium]